MNKSVRGLACVLTGLLLSGSLSSFAACGKTQSNNPEERPLVLATEALDGTFNPFFATSATDTEIISMTQIGMLSVDGKGKPSCGEDQPTVVKDYTETYISAADMPLPESQASSAKYTEYEFLIKNGIRFSDGTPLTIKDVLFNLYVYLDPIYTGSATIYSTDIVGLKAYRAQDETMSEMTEGEIQSKFKDAAMDRFNNLLAYLEDPSDNVETEEIKKDLATVKELLKDEIDTDWTNSLGQVKSFQDNKFSFTEDWQVYLYNSGIIFKQFDSKNEPVRDTQGNYVVDDTSAREWIAEATTQDKIDAYVAENEVSAEAAKEALIKAVCTEEVYKSNTTTFAQIADVLKYWMTGTRAIEEFAAEEKSAYYDKMQQEGGLRVPNVSGITTRKTKEFNGVQYKEEYDVLTIKINKIDPKAIWNFAFGVAPMHYYSNQEAIDASVWEGPEATGFGVKVGNKEFFDTVLKATHKTKFPVGAGVYMASDADGGEADGSSFYKNDWVYFERNPYFETVGEELHNAKIRKLRYNVVKTDGLLQQLEAGTVDYGEPNASVDNTNDVANIKHLTSIPYKTNGYGYVGVNPKHVPNIYIRRAIMKAMDVDAIINVYYGGELAERIYRPMSTTSWAYPKNATVYAGNAQGEGNLESVFLRNEGDDEIFYDTTEIELLVKQAGYEKRSDGKAYHVTTGESLTYTFTIAGESTDHPAYEMFFLAKEVLEKCGFTITVNTDVAALSKLAEGQLHVWAAAWSSTVDPDMYQVYHKDSQATSVNNWGYDVILKDIVGTYDEENRIINELSEKIDAGRKTLSLAERTEIYRDALDLVMELAVELPTYQRNDLAVLNTNVIDLKTVNRDKDSLVYVGVLGRIWEVNYV
ncbi:MAG: hypothetical protein IJ308_00965 [Clostridia bacterium]|nr:hypothetical protein [Clostridia bacterium]